MEDASYNDRCCFPAALFLLIVVDKVYCSNYWHNKLVWWWWWWWCLVVVYGMAGPSQLCCARTSSQGEGAQIAATNFNWHAVCGTRITSLTLLWWRHTEGKRFPYLCPLHSAITDRRFMQHRQRKNTPATQTQNKRCVTSLLKCKWNEHIIRTPHTALAFWLNNRKG